VRGDGLGGFSLLAARWPAMAGLNHDYRAIAKTPGRERVELAARNQQALNDGDEAGVEIAGFNSHCTEHTA
jgi:hypothetical protein